LLDNSIFKRVEADNRQPATLAHQHNCLRQRSSETAKLVVDGDAQRLKDARRGMDLLAPRPRLRSRNDLG
jgi:hypothetical protein